MVEVVDDVSVRIEAVCDDSVVDVDGVVVVLEPVVEVLDEPDPVELRYAVHSPKRLLPFAIPWSTPLVNPFLAPAAAAEFSLVDALGSVMFDDPEEFEVVEGGMEIPTFESDPDSED